jgi:hypothetical protein
MALEAILFNVANLIPPTAMAEDMSGTAEMADESPALCRNAAYDLETQNYLNALNTHWSSLSGYFSDRIIPPTKRWFASVRPVNFPTRRIAGVARLLTHFDFRRGLAKAFVGRIEDAMARQPRTASDFKREITQLSLLFSASGESYWSRHYTFGGKPTTKAMQLIGDDRAASVLFNALLPIGLHCARSEGRSDLESFIYRLIAHFPALPENTITRFMRHRLFGKSGGDINFRREINNQALFHVFHDCCNNNAVNCDDCLFYKLAEQPGGISSNPGEA